MNNDDERHLKSLLRHIDGVRQSCILLGERLYENKNRELSRRLIANGQIHDCSKFYGIEWIYLRPEFSGTEKEKLLEAAITQHVNTNPHHPEHWGGIEKMPSVYLAEMVCDWSTRSHEFGNDLRDWIKDKATKKFNMTVQSKVYKEIKVFVDLLLDTKI